MRNAISYHLWPIKPPLPGQPGIGGSRPQATRMSAPPARLNEAICALAHERMS